MTSHWLSPAQLAGLVKVGDVLVPGEGDLPSLSASNAAAAADRLFAHMAPGDRDAVRILLGVFRWRTRQCRELWRSTSVCEGGFDDCDCQPRIETDADANRKIVDCRCR